MLTFDLTTDWPKGIWGVIQSLNIFECFVHYACVYECISACVCVYPSVLVSKFCVFGVFYEIRTVCSLASILNWTHTVDTFSHCL